jgi:hypothetical protein
MSDGSRRVELKFDAPVGTSTLTATVPLGVTEEELVAVAKQAFSLVSSVHHCTCLSGRVSFVVEEDFSQAVEVALD